MFNFFKQKCPVCKMVLEKDRAYPEESGKKFCSESCKAKYQNQPVVDQSDHSHDGHCH